MDFFQAQEEARRSTRRLILLFVSAVVGLIITTNLFVMVFMEVFPAYFDHVEIGDRYDRGKGYANGWMADLFSLNFWQAVVEDFDWPLFWGISAGVIILVGGASLYRMRALSAEGGSAVAEMLDGRLINPNTPAPEERKVLNVVEEMAIAAGIPVPPVYVLPEEGINAFAAGFMPSDAIIGITEGGLRYLNRDQLQGVIAHELSHILNGDMRLNLRLMGLLHGLLVIAIVGRYLVRAVPHSGRRRDKHVVATMILGVGLMAIGFAGSFFGSLIKAAVSRQREYLADAAAVQFTRNPDGIADALKKIGNFDAGSVLKNPAALELSHAFFANGVLTLLFATHPPLEKRIRRLQPHWNGKFSEIPPQPSHELPIVGRETVFPGGGTLSAAATWTVAGRIFALDEVGQLRQQHLQYTCAFMAQIPRPLMEAMHEPYGARALIYALVINGEGAIRQRQLAHLEKEGDKGISALTLNLLGEVEGLDSRFRLPLINGSIASLRQLSLPQYHQFKKNLTALIEADNKLSLFEWALQKMVCHHLSTAFVEERRTGFSSIAKYPTLSLLSHEIEVVLSLLAYADMGNSAAEAFEAGRKELGNLDLKLLQKAELTLAILNRSVERLARLAPLLKPRLLKACAACITADKRVAALEAEVLRALSAAIDCPMPLLAIYRD